MLNIFNMLFPNMNNSRQYLGYNLISVEQAKDMIKNNEVILIDVRTKNEYDLVNIKGSINIPLNVLTKEIYTKIPDKRTKIMIYCASGYRSKSAIKLLNRMGYSNIYIWEDAAIATFNYKDMLVFGNEK